MRATRRLGSVLSLLIALLATAMVMGLLAAGLLIPAVGGAGLATNKSIDLFNGLPSTFAMNPLAQQSRILAADGSTIATPFNENRIVVPLNKVAPIMQKAQVAIEDERFFQHGGIDPKGLLRALTSNAQGGGVQGASTLTQQYVKVSLQNEALSSGNTTAARNAVAREGLQGYVRKLQELKYATALEQKYSKDQILDGYLNLVYYGDQQYGIEAAAEHYFSVPASKLNLPQAALLAGVVNQPTAYDPVNNPNDSKARRNIVLQKMYQQKIITFKQYSDASVSPISLKLKNVSGNCASSKYPYFCNYVENWLSQQPSLGKTVKARQAALESGGLTIKTSFQPKMAAILDAKLRARVPSNNKYGINDAAAMIKPGTGQIIATGQNTSYSTTAGLGKSGINLANSGFTFGSSTKFFQIVTALERNASPDMTIDVAPQTAKNADNELGTSFRYSAFQGPCYQNARGSFVIGNDFVVPTGKMTYARATAWSVNTAFTKLTEDVGMCNVVDTMVKLGLNRKDLQITPASVVLGVGLTSPIGLASAYATAAAGGMYCPPRPVDSMVDGNGKKLAISVGKCKRVMSQQVAAETTQIFRAVLNPDDHKATGYKAALANNRPAAGKTGTVSGANNIWFVGYTPQLATAVWVGHGSGSDRPLRNVPINGQKIGSGNYIFAGDLAAPMWKDIMDAALKGQPIKQFPTVPGMNTGTDTPSSGPSSPSSSSTSTQISVPNVVGQDINSAIATLQAAGFHVQVGPNRPGPQPRGQITAMSASGGSASQGTTIFIYPSSG
ncbi:transglycosylase domain-containing protein [Allobranchiibius sp. GilTou73]|uniref:transglycosylase domain-containing protein n=1 Tax=Allobranchiibius sp. GilTou73 TaxID=2904523 RepID=UPI001F28FD43|nr:transglycosylase domain-containing protein [Allobranchiibius sp. GilTou73]UIJ35117.1 transglycosylase domain-containing protein [Allobranchiibius sp. GilTou73]